MTYINNTSTIHQQYINTTSTIHQQYINHQHTYIKKTSITRNQKAACESLKDAVLVCTDIAARGGMPSCTWVHSDTSKIQWLIQWVIPWFLLIFIYFHCENGDFKGSTMVRLGIQAFRARSWRSRCVCCDPFPGLPCKIVNHAPFWMALPNRFDGSTLSKLSTLFNPKNRWLI
jgi:hypothetical protein